MSEPEFKGRVVQSKTTIYHLECPDCDSYFELTYKDTPCIVCGSKMKTVCEEVQEQIFEETHINVIEKRSKDMPYRHTSLEKYEQEKKQFDTPAD